MAANPKLDLTRFINKIMILVNKDLVSKRILQQIGKESSERIAKRTRLGYGVRKSGSKKEKLKGMRRHAPSYTLFRKTSKSSLSRFTTPNRVNLTLSGEMLGDIVVKIYL